MVWKGHGITEFSVLLKVGGEPTNIVKSGLVYLGTSGGQLESTPFCDFILQTLVKSFEVCDLPVRAARFVTRKNWVVAGSVSYMRHKY